MTEIGIIPTPTPSISEAPSGPGAAPNEASISDKGDSATPWDELPGLLQSAFQNGSPLCVMVTGALSSNLSVKLPDGKRTQSLPPGDIIVVVLPPKTRTAGIYLVEPS